MAIITDPDLLTRYQVIFVSASQKVSMYPVGDTQRNTSTSYVNAYVASTSTITAIGEDFGADGVIVGDVAAILDTVNGGHWFVNTESTNTLTLTDIDAGSAGAATTSLVANQQTFDGSSIPSDTITLTSHGYVSGDAVVYQDGGGTAPTGLTTGSVYYVIYVSANTLQLASSYANALAGTQITITNDGVGVSHTFDDRLIVGIFNNGARQLSDNGGEAINGNDTSGDGDGDLIDGATVQATYSYGKEEWRVDSLITGLSPNYNDDLIRHEFPYEAITSEQFEIGGGTAHDNWTWFNDYTVKKTRTGGWADKTSASVNDKERYTGVVTLGSLDADTQVYYQQTSATTAKTDFTFLGVVNEAVDIYLDTNQDGTPDNDYTTYLKLFARKKGRSYAQSEIDDIGVSVIQTIVNRFPLSHAIDTAITIQDAEILATSPYRNVGTALETGSDGSKTAAGTLFTSAGSTFQANNVVPGDVLYITSGTEQGYYEILDVPTETTLNITEVETAVGTDFTFSSGWASTESTLDFEILSTRIVADFGADGTVTDYINGAIINVAPATQPAGSLGSLTDSTNTPFTGVAAGDVLIITNSVGNDGTYKVVDNNYDSNAAAPTASVIYVNTIDQEFPAGSEANVEYRVNEPGMYLQYKNVAVQTVAATNYDFLASNGSYSNRPTITLTGDTWDAGVVAGTMIVVSTSENSENNGRYTVFAQETASIVSLVPTDTLVTNAADTAATVLASEGFIRDIGGVSYAYNWRLFGNNGTLQQCYEFVQNQLRESADIDWGDASSTGNITDLLMSFASPTGTGLNMFIDSLNTGDINNATFQDHSGANRTFPFTASGTLVFNTNLEGDTAAKYWLFFTTDDAGDNLGRDYGTKDAILVEDTDDVQITGDVNGAGNHTGSSGTVDASGNMNIPFTYDYDGNIQRGSASAATAAPVTLVAIGLNEAQFVISAGTITRATGITISAVAALERNYLT